MDEPSRRIEPAVIRQDRSSEGFVVHYVDSRVVAVTLDHHMACQLTGYHVNPVAELIPPAGHRCMILEDPDDASTFWRGGLIIRPDIDKGGPRGSGFIIGVGGSFGVGESPHPGGLQFGMPHHALGMHVVYGLYQGGIVNLDSYGGARGHEWQGRYLTMTDRDIWYMDFSPREKRDPAEEEAAGERLERMRKELAA